MAGAFCQALVNAVYDEEGTRGRVRRVFVGPQATLEATDYEDACPDRHRGARGGDTDDRLRREDRRGHSSKGRWQ